MNTFDVGDWTVVTDHSSIDDAQNSEEWIKVHDSDVAEARA
jgi:hypothetical protein